MKQISVGVRGEYTDDVFAKLGVKNIVVNCLKNRGHPTYAIKQLYLVLKYPFFQDFFALDKIQKLVL
jgi:hypothetical protein